MPRKTDSKNPADWLVIAESDLELVRLAAAHEIGFTAARYGGRVGGQTVSLGRQRHALPSSQLPERAIERQQLKAGRDRTRAGADERELPGALMGQKGSGAWRALAQAIE